MAQPLPYNEAVTSQRFVVQGKLGEGGMGSVYEAWDTERQARVALKLLHHRTPEDVLRFKGEFRKLQGLHHPNLVRLGELVEEQGQWFLSMELVHGTDFLSYLRGHTPAPTPSYEEPTVPTPSRRGDRVAEPPPPLPPESSPEPSPSPHLFDEARLRHALGQLALGLHALHRAGKVHRDIKPSNILVTSEGRVVLVDFGILSDIEEDEAWAGLVVGTAAYMAPEQAQGAAPSPEADWYSTGVLLYLALTGHKPFAGSPERVMVAKCREEPPPPESLVPGLPEDLARLCRELLRREPGRRPGGEQVLRLLGVEQQARQEAWGVLPSPFVGREAELRMLHQALRDSRQGTSVVVRVEGESGAGKTRLVRRFLEEVGRAWPQAVVLAGRCYERESVPFKGVDGLMDSLRRYLESQGLQEAAGLLPAQVSALGQLFPVLRGVGAPSQEGAPALSPTQVRHAAFSALRQLLERLATEHPLLLVVDDLQWADGDSAALLDTVLRAEGLLLVTTVRAGAPVPPPVAESDFWLEARRLGVGALSPEDAQALAERLCQQGGLLPEATWLRRLVQESGGHPFFLDALVRHAAAGGGRAERLEEALWERSRRLEPPAQRLLQLLCTADGRLSQAVAAHAMALETQVYEEAVASLRGAHLALTSGPSAEDLVEVGHDRVRQAVLPHLEPASLGALHERLALALEELGRGSLEQRARHWLGAGQPERAGGLYARAAREAAEALAFSQAAALYEQALAHGRWEANERGRLWQELGEVLGHSGRHPEAAQAFLRAAEGASASEAWRLRHRAADSYLTSGHMDEGLKLFRQDKHAVGLRCPETRPELLRWGRWQRLRTWLQPFRAPPAQPRPLAAGERERLDFLGPLVRGLAVVDPPLALGLRALYQRLAQRAGDKHHLCRSLCFELVYQARQNASPTRVERWQQRLLQVARLCPEAPALQGHVSAALAASCNLAYDFATARQHFERALALLERLPGNAWELSLAWSAGGAILAMMGELGEMARRFELPLAEAWERKDWFRLATLELNSGTLRWLGADQPQQGREAADAVISRWSQRAYHVQHFGHWMSHLHVDLYEGKGEEVVRKLEEAWPRLATRGTMGRGRALARLVEVRARARLQGASGGGRGEAWLRLAEEDARSLERTGLEGPRAMAALVRAGVAAARGQPQAVQGYARAARLLEPRGMLLYAAAARWRQGLLLGGSEGAALVEGSRAWMRQRGILRPERLVAMYAPLPGGHGMQ